MKFQLYSKLYQEALTYDDVDMYIGERGWQEWMDDYGEDNVQQITSILKSIFNLAHSTIKEMRETHKLGRAEFCRRYFKKLRTVENWDAGIVDTPEDQKMMIGYSFFIEDMKRNI